MRHISIIIPIYNEEQIIASSICRLIRELSKNILLFEIILVENGSSDNTRQIAKRLSQKNKSVRVISIPGPSFGAAIQKGVEAARYKSIFLFNADWWDINFILTSLPLLKRYPIIVGSKQLTPALDRRPINRKFGSKLLTLALKIMFHFHGSDSHGVKAFQKDAIQPLAANCITNEIVESELLIRAQRQGMEIYEVPLPISEVRPARIRFSTRIWRVTVELIRLRFRIIHSVSPQRIDSYIKIHADDVGLTLDTVKTAALLARKEKLQSLSILANTPFTSAACKKLRSLHIPIFLHFNLIEGHPVAKNSNRPTLTDSSENFFSWKIFALRTLFRKISTSDIKNELEAQLAYLRTNGVMVSGIDTHQHTHALSPVAEIVQGVAIRENLLVRSYLDMRTTSLLGKTKLLLFRLFAYTTFVVSYGGIGAPASWRAKTWQPFYLASWERVTKKSNMFLVEHPCLPYDKPYSA